MEDLRLLSRIALSLQNLENFEIEMKEILNEVGNFIDLSRIYMFFHKDENSMENIFEWYGKDITPKMQNLKNLKYENMVSFQKTLKKDGYICANDVMDLSKDVVAVLGPQEIRSLVVYPLIVDGEVRGFIGFDECRFKRKWKKNELTILSTLSGIIASAYERKLFQEEIFIIQKKKDENLKLFSKIFESNPLPMIISSIDERKLTKINPAFIKKIGYLEEEMLGKTIEELGLFIEIEKIEDIRQRLLKKENIKSEELIIKCKDGSLLIGLFSIEVVSGQGKEAFLTVMVDITQQRQQALELERFFSVNLDLLCIVDMEGKFIKLNKAWDDILGYSSEELKGHNILEFIHPEDIESTIESLKQLKEGIKVNSFVNRYIGVDEQVHYIEWRANSYENLIYAAARDITERIEYENTILEISNRDSLTKIYNRRYFYDRGAEIIEEYKRIGNTFSLCILDIDFFKNVNDNYGHQMGDYVLKELAKIVGENLRPYDILGRYGGEEFIIIKKNTNIEESSLIMERILDIVRNTNFTLKDKSLKITFSAGIVDCLELERDKMIIDNLVEVADKRMYDAKNAGKNRIVYKTMN